MDQPQHHQHHQPPPHHRYQRRRLRFSLFLALATATVLAAAVQTAPREISRLVPKPVAAVLSNATQTVLEAQPGLWHVAQTIDGDTIDVTLDGRRERIRLLGVDTPETHDPRKPVQCFGQAAADHTRQLLAGKNVRLEPDPEDSDRDKYGRLLRYVYLPDGTLVNAELISDGYAFAYTIFPLTKLDDFRTLEASARTANRGLWAGCHVNDSTAIKQTAGAK